MSDSRTILKRYTWWSVAAGLLPVPIYNFAAVGGVQLRMLSQLSKHHGVEFKEESGKSIVASAVGGLLPQELSRGAMGAIARSIPFVGSFLGPVTTPVLAGATTYAVGKVFDAHLASGGTVLDFDVTDLTAKQEFEEAFEEGKEEATKAAKATKK